MNFGTYRVTDINLTFFFQLSLTYSNIFSQNINLLHMKVCYYLSFEIKYHLWKITSGMWCPSTWMQFSSLHRKSAISSHFSPSIAATSSLIVSFNLFNYKLDFIYPHKTKLQVLKSGEFMAKSDYVYLIKHKSTVP